MCQGAVNRLAEQHWQTDRDISYLSVWREMPPSNQLEVKLCVTYRICKTPQCQYLTRWVV